jgi:hypothetical protein
MMLLLIRTSFGVKSVPTVGAIIAEVASIPVFWFGGAPAARWTAGKVASPIHLSDILESYVLALIVLFVLVVFWPMCRLVVRVGSEAGA